jgi:peptide/nickel transport system permease protein
VIPDTSIAQAEMVTVRIGLPWWQLLARDPLASCSAAWLVFLLVCMLFGPELLGKAATDINLRARNLPPGSTEQGWVMSWAAKRWAKHARAPGGRISKHTDHGVPSVVLALIVGGVLGLSRAMSGAGSAI